MEIRTIENGRLESKRWIYHQELQRFFNLTAPSVNSMLIRLEQRGFIRRVPRTARAIEITCAPEWIPRLERRFKV